MWHIQREFEVETLLEHDNTDAALVSAVVLLARQVHELQAELHEGLLFVGRVLGESREANHDNVPV